MPFLAGTTTPPIPKGLRHVPLSRVKVSNYMNSNSRIEKRGNDGFCVAYNSMSLVDKSRLSSLRSGGSVVLERPSFDQSQFDPSPQVEQGNLGFSPFILRFDFFLIIFSVMFVVIGII